MVHRAVLVLTLLLSFGCAWADEAKMPGEWKELTRSGITVYYQEDTKDLAPQILELAEKMLRDKPDSSGSAEIELLAKNKDKLLSFVASQLGLKEPSELARGVLDNFLEASKKLAGASLQPRRLRVWRKETLKRLLSEGREIAGFTYDKESDVVSLTWQATMSTNEGSESSAPTDVCMPIVIKDDPDTPPLDQARKTIEEVRGFHEGMMQMIGGGAVCHEVAEAMITFDVGVRGPFRRWFCEGAADYAAELCLREFVGPDAAREYAQGHSIGEHEAKRNQVDLIGWRAVEWEEETPQTWEEDIATARYAFAAHEVAELVKRHGPNTLTDIFKELAKAKPADEMEPIPDQAIYDAIKTATGEDMKAVLAGYSKEIKDEFRGIALMGLEIGDCKKNEAGGWRVAEPAADQPATISGKKGVCVRFQCAVMDPPAALEISLIDSAGGDESRANTQKAQLTSPISPISAHVWHKRGATPPGDYRLLIRVNGKLVKTVDVKVTAK